jgi:YfiH family protein
MIHDNRLDYRNGIPIYDFDAFARTGLVKHGFTGRKGGVSGAPFDTLNLGFTRPEPRGNVVENYKRLCEAEGIAYDSLVLVSYVHGDGVARVGASDAGRGFDRDPLPECDGIVTNTPGLTLVTLHADCLPVFLLDPVKKAIGLAHAGWKGTLARVGQKTAQRMIEAFGCAPQDIIAGIGPCICKRCFEVDEALAGSFADEFNCTRKIDRGLPGKAWLDLAACMEEQLMDAGIVRVYSMDACTFEGRDLLFSHRRDKTGTGAMAAFITLI